MMKTALAILLAAPILAGPALAESAPPTLPSEDPWFQGAQSALEQRRTVKPITRRAKNVILFIADGMDPTTVTAARIYDGQHRGEDGEENLLSFERLPWLAMSKTYTTNAQTADSAGTATAMLSGVKTKSGVIGVTDAAEVGDCASSLNAGALTLAELAEMAGMATGVVSTARLTHATPAAVYAHSPHRNWEADVDLTDEARESGCKDIASQFIDFPYGNGLEVAMGGGRSNFMPAELQDPEYPEHSGRRQDGRHLIEEWTAKSDNHAFVWNAEAFNALDPAAAPRVLALFERSHMQYETDRESDGAGEPSLAEMTAKSIDILSRERNGYFLMVEAGRVDHAHHGGYARRALKDTQAFADAVARAREMTNEQETLIIVTADHGHTMAFQGYPSKGNDILGLATSVDPRYADEDGHALAGDEKPYTTLVYANGPGSVFYGELDDGGRPAPRAEAVGDVAYRQQALIPSSSETHGGQDVQIYASGPRAHLFGGTVEQNYIFHVIDDALNLTRRAKAR